MELLLQLATTIWKTAKGPLNKTIFSSTRGGSFCWWKSENLTEFSTNWAERSESLCPVFPAYLQIQLPSFYCSKVSLGHVLVRARLLSSTLFKNYQKKSHTKSLVEIRK